MNYETLMEIKTFTIIRKIYDNKFGKMRKCEQIKDKQGCLVLLGKN